MTKNRWNILGLGLFGLMVGLVNLALEPFNRGTFTFLAVFGSATAIVSGWPLWTEMWKRSVGKMDDQARVGVFVGGGLILTIIAFGYVPMPARLIPITIGLIAIFAGGWPFWADLLGLFRKP